MKTNLFVVVLLVTLLLPSLALAGSGGDKRKQKATLAEYQMDARYLGIFKWERLYTFHEQRDTWFASKAPKVWSYLPCTVAQNSLRAKGHWVGNLNDNGGCAGYAEAPTWATGNYLNFLTTGKIKE